jgi:hypothetical protein
MSKMHLPQKLHKPAPKRAITSNHPNPSVKTPQLKPTPAPQHQNFGGAELRQSFVPRFSSFIPFAALVNTTLLLVR